MEHLEAQKKRLRQCDETILDTLLERSRIVAEIAASKRSGGGQSFKPAEQSIGKEWVARKLAGRPYQQEVLDVYHCILKNSRKIQADALFPYNLFFIGFMGVGKSTIAEYLGGLFARDVIEMDQVIAEREGMTIPDIFQIHGEAYFREAETKLLTEQRENQNVIVSCGGGTPMRACNVEEMKKSGRVILLDASPKTVYERVKNSHDRPLLEGNKSVAYISELMEKRRETYEAVADIKIETDKKSKMEICEELVCGLLEIGQDRDAAGERARQKEIKES